MRDRIECNIDITLSYICNLKAQGMDKTGEIMDEAWDEAEWNSSAETQGCCRWFDKRIERE